MTPAAHHPAIVAAVEALEWIATPGLGHSMLQMSERARAALALLRAAMEKAETMYLPVEGRGDYFKGLLITEQGRALCDTMPVERVTVLRWEE